ncbi:hypothetical protein JMA_42960 (plasmid) [Jeotgalibacillus malaysiensis]|uniref:Uncharacterized protein n=1 Tax=Jeotgalibacillus malaysiensis TaxID=1508404 RepID=A0A0B5AYM1_9BACL|nr:hypothetical protein [Jeotgalibacillus malaysiensis]AJD93613.1 hypothetical protein JMA_42960 [Jeotgalibacillus malaysiensis]
MEENQLIALDYLEEMGDKVVEILSPQLIGQAFEVTKEQPFPVLLMQEVANLVIGVAVENTEIRAFHVAPLIEGDLYMLDVQDKNQNSVATVMLMTNKAKSRIIIEDILVTFKKGAIIYRHEELLEQPSEEEVAG